MISCTNCTFSDDCHKFSHIRQVLTVDDIEIDELRCNCYRQFIAKNVNDSEEADE